MRFNQHSDLQGKHAFLSPSNYHWVNYSDEQLETRYFAMTAAQRGTDLHALAHEAIRLNIKLGRGNKAMAAYVNDAIAYKMTPEQSLYYSSNCFGTADAISFRRGKLRIHDLKTGITKVSMKQLEVYAAIFCLEYMVDPSTIEIELRIYQRDNVDVFIPTPEQISELMALIEYFDETIEKIKAREDTF